MANDVQISFVGTLGGDPEIKYGADGKARCRIRIAANPSRYDKSAGQWVEQGVTQWYSATAFDADAEAWADQLHKGQRVRIEGLLVEREYQAQSGEMRTSRDINNARITIPLPRNASNRSQDGFSAPHSGSSYTREVGNESPSERNLWTQGGAPF